MNPPRSRLVPLWPLPDITDPEPLALFPVAPLHHTFYHGELRQFFDEFVALLPDGGHCLDLAVSTVAATSAMQAASDRSGVVLTVDTIDVSELATEAHGVTTHKDMVMPPPVPQIEYRGVLSVFGFEVLDQAHRLSWLQQILTPGGIVSCLALALEAPMVRECLDYIRVFGTVLRPWWDETRVARPLASRIDVERRTRSAIAQLKLETHREPIRQALERVMLQLNELAAADRAEMNRLWMRLDQHTERLRTRMARAVDAGTIRQFIRDVEHAGFRDVCVVPFELYGWLFGWNWTAERLRSE